MAELKMGPKRTWQAMKDLNAGFPEGTRPTKDIERDGEAAYRERYNAGWRYSERGSSLDAADARGLTDSEAWMDGYLDMATGRDRYHITFCPDHDSCP
jgi:hypothetical protein